MKREMTVVEQERRARRHPSSWDATPSPGGVEFRSVLGLILEWLESPGRHAIGQTSPRAQRQEKEFADKFNSLSKVIFSKSLERAPWGKWKEGRIVKRGAVKEVASLKQQPARDTYSSRAASRWPRRSWRQTRSMNTDWSFAPSSWGADATFP
jgi:hypothetical protein